MLFKKLKNKKKQLNKKKRRVMHMIKKIIMSKIANQKTLFDDNSTLYWKNNSKHKRKKNKNTLITKQSKFHSSILKMKNFLKSTNHKIFKMFWTKQNEQIFLWQQKTMSMKLSTHSNINQLLNILSTNLKHFIQIQQKKLKLISIKIVTTTLTTMFQ